jgi:anaerobic glycerol-3-phosphate dehydrogenase
LKLIVVGGGFAGLSAAFHARRAGAEVTLLQARSGASALYAGVLDGRFVSSSSEQQRELRLLMEHLGLRFSKGCIVATREGVIRASLGADAGLLDLQPLSGKTIALLDTGRDDADADLLARALSESVWARSSATRFEARLVDLLESSYERRIPAADFAALFDDPERRQRLVERVQAAPPADAWLSGPWLGFQRAHSNEISRAVGVPIGEVTSAPGGAAGHRFERRAEELLQTLDVTRLERRAIRVEERDAGVVMTLADGEQLVGDAVVLAAGGIVAGAIQLRGKLSGAEQSGFHTPLDGLPELALDGRGAHRVSSLYGPDLAARGIAALERVGVPALADGTVHGLRRVFAAGDLLAPEPPSVMFALGTGQRAAATAIARFAAME